MTKLENDMQRIKRERKVKDIFNKLGINSAKELPKDVASLESVN